MGQKSWYGTCWYDTTPHQKFFLGVMVQGWKVLANRKLCQLEAKAAALSLRDEP